MVGHGRKPFQKVREVGLRFYAVAFARFDQRVDHSAPVTGSGMTDKQPVPHSQFARPDALARRRSEMRGEFTFLDREAPLLHFDFEENFAMKDRIVLGFALYNRGNPFKSEVEIGGVTCDRSFPNRGAFGRNYDAQNGNIELAEGPRGKAGVFNPQSQMAVYGAGPHSYGNVVSYALWMKTSSDEDMMLINTGRGGLKRGLMNLNLNDAKPELLMAEDQRLIAKSRKLNDGKWHHIAVSMPGKDCKLSELQFYVDGEPVESEVLGKDAPINVSMVNKISVGGVGHDRGRSPFAEIMHTQLGIKPFEGALDEVTVWARALSTQEVAKLAK